MLNKSKTKIKSILLPILFFGIFGSAEMASALPIFPGAQGFGTETRGVYGLSGTNPAIYKITNLNSSGASSLKDCVSRAGPRICVFEVSGAISLDRDLVITEPYLTIAGQSAPSPGIMLKDGKIAIETHDILIQHIRVRPGDAIGSSCVSGADNCDGVDINDVYQYLYGGSSRVYNVVIDHCSFSWSMDEILSTWYAGVNNVSISNSLFSEGLYESYHPKGAHGYGPLIGNNSKKISLSGNLIAHFQQRNPLISLGSESIFYNNLVYNYGIGTAIDAKEGSKTSLEGNVYIPGPNSGSILPIYPYNGDGSSTVFVSDNIWNGASYNGANRWECVRNDNYIKSALSPVSYPPGFSLKPGLETESFVLDNAGARPIERDSVDTRIINDARNKTGKWIDCVASSPNHVRAGGLAEGGSSSTILLDKNFNGDNISTATDVKDWYNNMNIMMISGACSGQARIIADYSGSPDKIVTVSEPWSGCVPALGDGYEIIIDCSLRNAGGWPTIAENYRVLEIPDNPHADDDHDGYTNIEEQLHNFSLAVETGDIPLSAPSGLTVK